MNTEPGSHQAVALLMCVRVCSLEHFTEAKLGVTSIIRSLEGCLPLL